VKSVIKKLYSDILKIGGFLRRAEISSVKIILSAVLSLLATASEAVFVVSLIPFVKGAITQDFMFIRDIHVFKNIFYFFPQTSAPNTVSFIALLSVIFVSVILKNLFTYLSILLVSYQIRNAASNVRKIIFGRYLSFGKLFFDRSNSGQLQSVLVAYISAIANQLKSLNEFFSNSFMFLMYLAIMFVISWELTILIFFSLPFLNYSLNWLVKKIKKTSASYTESYAAISKKVSNILSCVPLIKLYRSEKKEADDFSSLSSQLRNNEFSLDKKLNFVTPIHEIAFLMMIMLLVAAMSFMLIKQKKGDTASFMVFFYLLKKCQYSFGVLSSLRSSLAAVRGHISQVVGMLDDREKFIIPDTGEEFTGLKRNIEFKNISFSYLPDLLVVNKISFLIEKNKNTAIVGPTGSGKTTLISLLLRFYDYSSGNIRIDGREIKDLSLKSLMNHFAYVSQEIMLLNDTIKNNIIYGLDRKISEKEIIEVSKKARIYNFVMSLPRRFDTYIGDRGVKLSGGEKQRVSIARALLKGTEVLIMDEATSSLDSKTERLIQQAINEAVKDKTAVIIAHRLSTIQNADKIVVIEDGRLMEEGGLDELLKRKGKFYEYWQEQKFY